MGRARSTANTPGGPVRGFGRRGDDSYGWLSTRPLHVLVFLLPLMILYEVGSVFYLSDPSRGVMETIGARGILGDFFEAFGVASLHLPPIALFAVLVMWHFFERDPWKLRPQVLAGMLAESVLWTLPILVVGLILGKGQAAAAMELTTIADRSWQARLTLAIGAGIYEELLFRLILVTAVHFIVVDLFRLSNGVGFVVAAVVSAMAFALYHDVSAGGGGADLTKFLFLAAAGLYFAALFILRGFGVAVATHALYDVVVLLAVAPATQPST
jgi:membrane protease YdiL (CAAX protease family)